MHPIEDFTYNHRYYTDLPSHLPYSSTCPSCYNYGVKLLVGRAGIWSPFSVKVDNSSSPTDYGLNGKNFYLETSTGLLPVWYLYSTAQNRSTANRTKLMVYVHGTSYSRMRHLPAYKTYLSQGFDLIVPELPGFHEAISPFTGSTAVADLKQLHFWMAVNFRLEEIVWWCYSMGAGICLETLPTLQPQPGGLILEAPFFSMRAMLLSNKLFTALAGWFPSLTDALLTKMESRYGMSFENSKNLLKLTDIPVLHIMSEDDQTISYEHHFARIRDPVRQQILSKVRRASYFPVTMPACRGLQHYPMNSGVAQDVARIVSNFWEEVNWPGRHTNLTAKNATIRQ